MKLSYILGIVLFVFCFSCKKENNEEILPEKITPVEIILPSDSSLIYGTEEVVFKVDTSLNIIRFEYYIDYQLFQAFDYIPQELFFNAALFPKGSVHHIYIRILNKDGITNNSNIITLITSKLAQPDLVAKLQSKTAVELSWHDNSNSESGYRIKRKVDNQDYIEIISMSPNTEKYIDATIDTTKSYSYKVEVFSTQESLESNIVGIEFILNKYMPYKEFSIPDAVSGKVAISPDAQKIVATNYYNTNFSVINTATGQITYLPQNGGTLGLAISNNGNIFATGGTSSNELIRFWDLNTNAYLGQIETGVPTYGLIFNKSDDQIVVAGEPVKIYNFANGNLVREYMESGSYYRTLMFSKDETLLLAGGNDNLVKLYSASSGDLIRTFAGHQGNVVSVCFSSDESKIYSGSNEDGYLIIWDKVSGNEIKRIKFKTGIVSIHIKPNGEIIVATVDGLISVLDQNVTLIQTINEMKSQFDSDYNSTYDLIAAYDSDKFKIRLFKKIGHWEIR